MQSKAVIHRQPLITPQILETTAAEELIILSNLDIFEKNGFKIDVVSISEHNSNTMKQKLRLLTVPYSTGIQFNYLDVHELASLIETIQHGCYDSNDVCELPNLIIKNYDVYDAKLEANRTDIGNLSTSSNVHHVASNREKQLNAIKLPKLVSKFASRACRTATMVGSALKMSEMRSIVNNLGTIDQPWNCPHGRPTLRHLADMNMFTSKANTI